MIFKSFPRRPKTFASILILDSLELENPAAQLWEATTFALCGLALRTRHWSHLNAEYMLHAVLCVHALY